MKRPAGKAGVGSIRREAEKLVELAKLGITDDLLASLGQRKIVFLSEQANRYTIADLRALSEQRRALILLAFVIRRRQLGRDTILEQMEKIQQRMTRNSKKLEEETVLKREKVTPFSRRVSTRILEIIATAEPGSVEEKLFEYMPQAAYRRIYDAVNREEEDFSKKTYRASLLRRYEHHYRKMLPLILTHVPFQSQSPEGIEVLETIGLLKEHVNKRTQQFTLRHRPRFLDPAWDDVTVLDLDEKVAQSEVLAPDSISVARRPFELQTIFALQGALKSGAISVDGSERYSNLTSTLVPWDELRSTKSTSFPPRPGSLLPGLRVLCTRRFPIWRQRSSAGAPSQSRVSTGGYPKSSRMSGSRAAGVERPSLAFFAFHLLFTTAVPATPGHHQSIFA